MTSFSPSLMKMVLTTPHSQFLQRTLPLATLCVSDHKNQYKCLHHLSIWIETKTVFNYLLFHKHGEFCAQSRGRLCLKLGLTTSTTTEVKITLTSFSTGPTWTRPLGITGEMLYLAWSQKDQDVDVRQLRRTLTPLSLSPPLGNRNPDTSPRYGEDSICGRW